MLDARFAGLLESKDRASLVWWTPSQSLSSYMASAQSRLFQTQSAEASSSWYTEFTCPWLSHDLWSWCHAILWQCLMIATFISVFGGCRHLDLSGVSQRPLCCCDAAVGCVGRKTQISVLIFILRSIARLNLCRHILLALSS